MDTLCVSPTNLTLATSDMHAADYYTYNVYCSYKYEYAICTKQYTCTTL